MENSHFGWSTWLLVSAAVLSDAKRRRIRLPAGGVEIALLDWGGDGPLALLHHANGFCAAMWALVAEGLRAHFRVVAMDARGHGDSSKPEEPEAYDWAHFPADLVEVAEVLCAEAPVGRVDLTIGHSFGGVASLGAAAARPELFHRLLLLDPVVHPRPTPEGSSVRRARKNELVRRALRRKHRWPDRAAARERLASRELFAPLDPRAVDLYVEHALEETADGHVELKCPREVEARIFERGGSFDLYQVGPSVQASVLFLWAKRGDFPRPLYQDLADLIPDASVEDIDSGHLVPMECPDLVVNRALRFSGVTR